MKLEKRQVEGKPLTVIVEYPEWNRSVEDLVRKIEKLDVSFVGRTDSVVNEPPKFISRS